MLQKLFILAFLTGSIPAWSSETGLEGDATPSASAAAPTGFSPGVSAFQPPTSASSGPLPAVRRRPLRRPEPSQEVRLRRAKDLRNAGYALSILGCAPVVPVAIVDFSSDFAPGIITAVVTLPLCATFVAAGAPMAVIGTKRVRRLRPSSQVGITVAPIVSRESARVRVMGRF